eukprot:CAMPEP_0194199566 /NCGR_PEP_ID=MMETSP0156-20130528/541_1 /TAXON_ID=33649 /ORGANISM="Thalassionema nitzschioides, Strain L26-B" /LENGTH=323 /DNA_ID=CAMNT_0038924483 /DNA_START=161 /DNA_END=1132 /DNA_ORIENTATION=+
MRAVIVASLVMCVATGFMPSPKISVRPATSNAGSSSRLFAAKAARRKNNVSPIKTITAPYDNLMAMLPWNARRLEDRKARKIRRDIAKLHREMGIPEDAPYEDLQAATDRLIMAAGQDIKKRLKVEKAKDEILHLRLSERMAGLASVTTEAKSQTTYERQGAAEAKEEKRKSRPVPQWRDGIVVKPDEKWLKRTIAIWGTFIIIPFLNGGGGTPVLTIFQMVFLAGQLMWRGVPKEQQGGGNFRPRSGTIGFAHQKVTWLLSFGIFLTGKLLGYCLVPPPIAKSVKATALWSWTLECGMFCAANLYLQPYKPEKYKKSSDDDE